MKNTWRMIVVTTMLSLIAIGASYAALSAAGEEPPVPDPSAVPATDEAPAPTSAESNVDPNDDGEGAVPPQDPDLPPDLRFNADDTFSFPVGV